MELGAAQNWSLHLGVLGCVLACVWVIGGLVRPKLFRPWWGSALLGAGSLLLVPFLVGGLQAVGGRAFGDLFFTLILILGAVGVITLILGAVYRTEAMIAFISPLVLMLSLGAAVTALPSSEPTPGIPWWVGLGHGMAMFLAFACFAATFAAGATYLLQEASLRGVQFPKLIWRLPSLESAERIGFLAATAGVVLLTVSIGSGIFWQSRAGSLGETWYLDPTVIFGVLTWLLYAALIGSRAGELVRGRRLAVVYVGAFLFVIFTFVGTSFFFQGSHRTFRTIEGADHHGFGGEEEQP